MSPLSFRCHSSAPKILQHVKEKNKQNPTLPTHPAWRGDRLPAGVRARPPSLLPLYYNIRAVLLFSLFTGTFQIPAKHPSSGQTAHCCLHWIFIVLFKQSQRSRCSQWGPWACSESNSSQDLTWCHGEPGLMAHVLPSRVGCHAAVRASILLGHLQDLQHPGGEGDEPVASRREVENPQSKWVLRSSFVAPQDSTAHQQVLVSLGLTAH